MPAIRSLTVTDTGITMIDAGSTRTFLNSSLTAGNLSSVTNVENAIKLWATGLSSRPYAFAVRCFSTSPLSYAVATGDTQAAADAAVASLKAR